MIAIILISIIWFIAFTKKLFFWVYLWQLKEYHIGRFLDHFHTHKGKKLFLNYLLPLKILVLAGIVICARSGQAEIKTGLVFFVGLIFLVEALFALKNVLQKTFRLPIVTRKVAVILSTGFSVEILIIFSLLVLEFRVTKVTVLLLGLDIIAPIVLSFLVLAFQPLAVFSRNRIIKRAKAKRAGFKNLLVIGVTGSYGKTSVKECLATILSEKFNVLKTEEHQNSEVGVSQCILQELDQQHEVFVCEMGAYNRGGIKLLSDIARPKMGILTGINEQHMATFGSQENIIKGKFELIESLPENGTAFFNTNNRYCMELYQKTKIQKRLYGDGADSLEAENIAGAAAVARELGLTPEEIEKGVEKIDPKQKSLQMKIGMNGVDIINATYSANPNGVMAHLDYLKSRNGKKVIVMPCMIELGRSSKDVHIRIGKKIGEVCDLSIITTRDRFGEIKEGAPNALFIEDPNKIFEKIKDFCGPGDTVLLESRVPRQLIKQLI